MASSNATDDFEDWLKLTKWYEVEYRNQRLAHYRALAAIEQEEASIAARKESLIQGFKWEEMGSYGSDRPTLASHTVLLPGASFSNKELTIRTQFAASAPVFTPDRDLQGQQDVRYPAYNANEKSALPPRTTGSHWSPGMDDRDGRDDSRGRRYNNTRGHSRGRSIQRYGIHRRDRSRSPLNTSWRRLPSQESRPSHDNRKDHVTRRHVTDNDLKTRYDDEIPKVIDLGQEGDTRFFSMRSFNFQNIYDAHDDGLWATKPANAQVLTDAFYETKNVILFFSVNGSHAFQGYARMAGVPSSANPQPRWYRTIGWPISEPFRIEWYSRKTCDDGWVRCLKNSLNENLPPTRARDGQEMDDKCGRDMVRIFNREALKK